MTERMKKMENNIIGKILFSREQIEERARELGRQICEDYVGEELYLVGTLKGAVMWMGDLMKNISNDAEIDFIVASSYGSGTTTSGVVKIKRISTATFTARMSSSLRISWIPERP